MEFMQSYIVINLILTNTDKEVVLVTMVFLTFVKLMKGKSERLGILLERGTYVLTAFIRGYEGLNPATDMKIIKVI